MKRFLLMGITLGFLLSWALESIADQPKRGGTLTMAIRKDIDVMNPLVGTKSTDGRIRELMFEPLLGIDLQGKVHPNLAESWEMSEAGKLYTFKLRKGVKFHNGKEMTSEDVKFAIDYTLNPKNGAYGLSRLALLDRAEVVGKYILKLYLKKAGPGFLSVLTNIQTFSVVPKESLPEGVEKPVNFPPGTGPFKLVEWKPARRIVMERYDNYWGHKAFIDKLVLRPVRDATVRFTALRAGDVDMVARAPLEWVRQIVKGKIKGVNFASAKYAEFRSIEFNVAAPPFDSKKLRQAVVHAINKEELLQASFFGFGEPTDQKYPKGHAWYMEGIPSPTYDPDKSRVLLKEAGYKGQTIEMLTQQSAAREAEAAMIQAQLKKVGMKIKITMVGRGVYHALLRKGDFAFHAGGGSLYADPSLTYGPDLRCAPDLKKRSGNSAGYCQKEMDALIDSAEAELDPDKRRVLFKQILNKVVEDVPELYVGYGPQFYTFRDYVKGFTTDGDAAFRWWGGGLSHTWLDK